MGAGPLHVSSKKMSDFSYVGKQVERSVIGMWEAQILCDVLSVESSWTAHISGSRGEWDIVWEWALSDRPSVPPETVTAPLSHSTSPQMRVSAPPR